MRSAYKDFAIKQNPHKVPPDWIFYHRKDVRLRKLQISAKRKLRDLFCFIVSRFFFYNIGCVPDWILDRCEIATKPSPAYWHIFRLIDSIENFHGDVCECGVYRGKSLVGMAIYLVHKRKGFRNMIFGFDSFEGLPKPDQKDLLDDKKLYEGAQKGMFNDTSYHGVVRKLKLWRVLDRVNLVKGYFDDTLRQVVGRKYQLVHLDIDLYQSYLDCLRFFYPRMVSGGYIIFDEYGHDKTYPGAKRAVDDFFVDKPEKVRFFEGQKGRGRKYFVQIH